MKGSKLLKLLVSATLVITQYCVTYCQGNPYLGIRLIDRDTMFVFNKSYAQVIVNKFDSLDQYKKIVDDLNINIRGCLEINEEYNLIIGLQSKDISNLENQIKLNRDIIISHERTDKINEVLKKDLEKKTRKAKIWSALAWSAIGVSGILATLIILK